jgi:hypothetical protein
LKSLWRGILVAVLVSFLVPWPGFSQDGGDGIRVLEVDDQPTGPRTRAVNRILAVVENQAITMREYELEFGDTEVTRPRLNRLINRALIQQAGRESGIILDRARVRNFVDSRVQSIKQRGASAFDRFLRQRGITEAEYRSRLIQQIRNQRLRSRVLIRFYPQLAQPDTRAAQQLIKGRMMVLPDSGTAYEVYRALKQDPTMSTWDREFQEHSRKLGFMDENGELDWFTWGTYSREIEYRFFKNDLLRLSRPFQLRGQYALVIPTGFRLNTLARTASEDLFRLYESFRRRFYTEQLSERLRDRYSVNIPESVQQELNRNVQPDG